MSNPYTLKIDPFAYESSTFWVTCTDAVVKMRIEQHITQHGGTLSAEKPDYLVGERGLSPVQFWIGAGQYDVLQTRERLEETLVFLSSATPFPDHELEKIYWYIRENRDQVIEKIFSDNLTETLEGFLNHYHQVLPQDYTAILQPGQYENRILLDLVTELVDRAEVQGNHELKAWLMEYRKATFPDSFVEEMEQEKLDKELGVAEQNEYDWLKLFSFTYEEDGVHIDRYKGDSPFVFIPDSIEGKPVTSVAIRNFFGCAEYFQYVWQRPLHLVPAINRESLAAAQVGDIVEFGLYPLDKSGNTAPIRWQVLKQEENRILVITEKIIDKSAYHTEAEPIDWASCHLRRWLNGPFLSLAFTLEEQELIPEVELPSLPNPKYKSGGGASTFDRIFALSLQEAAELFPDDPSRLGYTTLYAQSRGYYFGGQINCWWLRGQGASPSLAALVGNSGSLGTYGYRPDNGEYAVRPAMWIQIGG